MNSFVDKCECIPGKNEWTKRKWVKLKQSAWGNAVNPWLEEC